MRTRKDSSELAFLTDPNFLQKHLQSAELYQSRCRTAKEYVGWVTVVDPILYNTI